MTLIEHVQRMLPRKEYKDFDELFLGYAVFYVDQEQSMNRLKPILQDHPTWIVPRAILAASMSHLATRKTENAIPLIEEAMGEIEIVQRFAGDNPFILLHCLHETNSSCSGEHL